MRKIALSIILSVVVFGACDKNAQKLVNSYSKIVACRDNKIILSNGKSFIYDDGKIKSFNQLLNNPDIEDMFKYRYPRGWVKRLPKNFDPGRIRFVPLFRELYGHSASEVKRSLTTIPWFGSYIKVTQKEGVAKALMAVYRDLKALPPQYKKFLTPIGGTFKWRYIAGTSRLSVHSFGAAIDINVKYSAYWRWSKGVYRYQNKIPKAIVDIFERHGFIWGGKWYHYDTMHFEYRPELVFRAF
jgi:uncharacterized protein YcfL